MAIQFVDVLMPSGAAPSTPQTPEPKELDNLHSIEITATNVEPSTTASMSNGDTVTPSKQLPDDESEGDRFDKTKQSSLNDESTQKPESQPTDLECIVSAESIDLNGSESDGAIFENIDDQPIDRSSDENMLLQLAAERADNIRLQQEAHASTIRQCLQIQVNEYEQITTYYELLLTADKTCVIDDFKRVVAAVELDECTLPNEIMEYHFEFKLPPLLKAEGKISKRAKISKRSRTQPEEGLHVPVVKASLRLPQLYPLKIIPIVMLQCDFFTNQMIDDFHEYLNDYIVNDFMPTGKSYVFEISQLIYDYSVDLCNGPHQRRMVLNAMRSRLTTPLEVEEPKIEKQNIVMMSMSKNISQKKSKRNNNKKGKGEPTDREPKTKGNMTTNKKTVDLNQDPTSSESENESIADKTSIFSHEPLLNQLEELRIESVKDQDEAKVYQSITSTELESALALAIDSMNDSSVDALPDESRLEKPDSSRYTELESELDPEENKTISTVDQFDLMEPDEFCLKLTTLNLPAEQPDDSKLKVIEDSANQSLNELNESERKQPQTTESESDQSTVVTISPEMIPIPHPTIQKLSATVRQQYRLINYPQQFHRLWLRPIGPRFISVNIIKRQALRLRLAGWYRSGWPSFVSVEGTVEQAVLFMEFLRQFDCRVSLEHQECRIVTKEQDAQRFLRFEADRFCCVELKEYEDFERFLVNNKCGYLKRVFSMSNLTNDWKQTRRGAGGHRSKRAQPIIMAQIDVQNPQTSRAADANRSERVEARNDGDEQHFQLDQQTQQEHILHQQLLPSPMHLHFIDSAVDQPNVVTHSEANTQRQAILTSCMRQQLEELDALTEVYQSKPTPSDDQRKTQPTVEFRLSHQAAVSEFGDYLGSEGLNHFLTHGQPKCQLHYIIIINVPASMQPKPKTTSGGTRLTIELHLGLPHLYPASQVPSVSVLSADYTNDELRRMRCDLETHMLKELLPRGVAFVQALCDWLLGNYRNYTNRNDLLRQHNERQAAERRALGAKQVGQMDKSAAPIANGNVTPAVVGVMEPESDIANEQHVLLPQPEVVDVQQSRPPDDDRGQMPRVSNEPLPMAIEQNAAIFHMHRKFVHRSIRRWKKEPPKSSHQMKQAGRTAYPMHMQRIWIETPMLYNASFMKEMRRLETSLRMSCWIRLGHPGLLCAEGQLNAMREFWKELREFPPRIRAPHMELLHTEEKEVADEAEANTFLRFGKVQTVLLNIDDNEFMRFLDVHGCGEVRKMLFGRKK